MTYAAFIAKSLRTALQGFAKPWYRLRGLHLFQDSASLSLDPSLWQSVTRALDDSQYLMVLASPQAASSEWVDKEIAHWLEGHSIETVLLVLTRGHIA